MTGQSARLAPGAGTEIAGISRRAAEAGCRLQKRGRQGRRTPGGGFTSRHEVMTEERLEVLARRFLRLRIRALTGARFEEYAGRPECLEDHAKQMLMGCATRGAAFERRGGLQ